MLSLGPGRCWSRYLVFAVRKIIARKDGEKAGRLDPASGLGAMAWHAKALRHKDLGVRRWTVALMAVLTLLVPVLPAAAQPLSLPALSGGSAPIRIGVIMSRTGPYAEPSRAMIQALELTDQRIDDAGGVLINGERHKLELVFVDDKSDPEVAARQAAALAKDPAIMAIIGPYSSDNVLAIRNQAETVGIPVINTAGAAPTLHRLRDVQWLFSIGATATTYFQPIIDLAARHLAGGKQFSVGLVNGNDLFGQAIHDSVVAQLHQHEIPLRFQSVVSKSSDIGLLLDEVAKVHPTLLIFSLNDSVLSRSLLSGLADRRINVDMLAISGCRAANLQSLGVIAEYTLCPVQWDGFANFPDSIWGSSTQFLASFEVAFGEEPPYQAAQAAAALEVIAKALDRQRGTVTRQSLRQMLAKTDVATVFGKVRFGVNGRNDAVTPMLEQIRGGSYMTVLPPQRAWVPLVQQMPSWEDRMP